MEAQDHAQKQRWQPRLLAEPGESWERTVTPENAERRALKSLWGWVAQGRKPLVGLGPGAGPGAGPQRVIVTTTSASVDLQTGKLGRVLMTLRDIFPDVS